ncbi:Na/Pi cotransporter family protein [Marinicrinis sediminis]|uniref:Na/Pi cotransporter family protein n=1 Tax=Marinicrinis sediminis TaxID=1652465 RepID=A0ABW5RCI5_9BACL
MFHSIMIPLCMGLSVFLFGMKLMELALFYWAGNILKYVLKRFTATPLRGLLTGGCMTALLQSGSAITAISIGLVNTGLLSFPRTLGIILGTNIGAAITTELIGHPVSRSAVPLLLFACGSCTVAIVLSVLHQLLSARRPHRLPVSSFVHASLFGSIALAGFSCVLLGMEQMSTIGIALQHTGFFIWFLELAQRSLLLGLLAGICLTAVIQSSSASIAITMGLASVQAISFELGMAIIMGANIGSCVTGFIASIGGSRSGQFVAWSHFFLNAGGALLFFPLIPLLSQQVMWSADSPSDQLAHFQTLFNVISSLLVLPLCYLPVWRKEAASRI